MTPPPPTRPAYGGACVDNLIPALVGRTDAAWLPEPARNARAVVVFVLDGLGWELLQEHRDELPELAALTGGPITTVAPSTTATALTSITTGLAPSVHGILGYRMRVDGRVLNVLRWTVDDGRPPDPTVVQRHPPFLGRTVPVVTRKEFRTSGFSAAHLRDVPFAGWSTPMMIVEQCRDLVTTGGHRLVYAYYPGVDTVAHEYGLTGPYLAAELRFADELVGRLRDALPADAAVLVTADHGEVQVGDRWHDLTPLGDLVRSASGEGRFRWLTAPKGAGPALAEAATDAFGALAWVMTREQLVDEGWLGPRPMPPVNLRRLGDVVLLPHAPVGFIDPATPKERLLIGAHGSLTAAEMLVPAVAGAGRRG